MDRIARWALVVGITLAAASAAVVAAERGPASGSWLADMAKLGDQAPQAGAAEGAAPQKPPPLPVHNLEGVGGIVAMPTAYLVNPGPEGTKIGLPAASLLYLNIGKNRA